MSARGDRVYVTGTSEHPQHTGQHVWDVALACYDARTGRQLWLRVARVGTDQRPATLALAPKGDAVYVLGSATTGPATAPVAESLALAYTASGAPRWTVHRRLGAAVFAPVAVAVSPRGDRVYVTGARTEDVAPAPGLPAQRATAGVEAIDAKTGKVAWSAAYTPPAGYSAAPRRLVVNAAGTRLYVAADLLPGGTVGYPVVVAFTAAGARVWTARYDVRDPLGAGSTVTGGVRPVDAVMDAAGRNLYVAVDAAPAVPAADTQLCAAETAAGVADGCATSPGHSAVVLAYAG